MSEERGGDKGGTQLELGKCRKEIYYYYLVFYFPFAVLRSFLKQEKEGDPPTTTTVVVVVFLSYLHVFVGVIKPPKTTNNQIQMSYTLAIYLYTYICSI